MIEVDDREWNNHSTFRDFGDDIECEKKRLKIGDFNFNGICVERKEINDLVTSLDNRLWEQLVNMEDNFDANCLIIEGTISDLSTQNMEPRKISAYYGVQARVAISYNVNVITVREKSQTKKLIEKMYRKSFREADKVKPHLEKRNFRDDRMNVLFGIKGLGSKTIKNILDEIGSVREVANADVEELKEVDGVGEKTATKIYELMREGEETKRNTLI